VRLGQSRHAPTKKVLKQRSGVFVRKKKMGKARTQAGWGPCLVHSARKDQEIVSLQKKKRKKEKAAKELETRNEVREKCVTDCSLVLRRGENHHS